MKNFLIAFVASLSMVTAIANAKTVSDETRPVSGFTAIASSGSFHVFVKINGSESLKISADASIIDKIETIVENGTLKIRFKSNWNDHDDHETNIYVSAKALSSLVNSGSGSIKVDNNITATKMNVVLSGSGSITTMIKSDYLSAVISGSGSLNLSGSTNDASFTISGSGSVVAKNLKTNSTHVNISGSGNLSINAERELTSNILGSGSIRYSGNAKVSTSKLGSGSVTREN